MSYVFILSDPKNDLFNCIADKMVSLDLVVCNALVWLYVLDRYGCVYWTCMVICIAKYGMHDLKSGCSVITINIIYKPYISADHILYILCV